MGIRARRPLDVEEWGKTLAALRCGLEYSRTFDRRAGPILALPYAKLRA
jgi:hypothetical protein